jgi:hypothetical protein
MKMTTNTIILGYIGSKFLAAPVKGIITSKAGSYVGAVAASFLAGLMLFEVFDSIFPQEISNMATDFMEKYWEPTIK